MLYVAETWQCSLYRFHTLIRMPPCRICNIKWHICTWFCLRMRDHFKDKGLCSDLLPCVTVNLHCQLDWNSNQLGLLGYGVSGESGESGGWGGSSREAEQRREDPCWVWRAPSHRLKKATWTPTYTALLPSNTLNETMAHPTATMPPHPEELYRPKLWAETSFCLFLYVALVSNDRSNSYKSQLSTFRVLISSCFDIIIRE